MGSEETIVLGGTRRLSRLIEQERQKVEERKGRMLLLDAGDMFLGSQFFAFFFGEVEIKVMDLLGKRASE